MYIFMLEGSRRRCVEGSGRRRANWKDSSKDVRKYLKVRSNLDVSLFILVSIYDMLQGGWGERGVSLPVGASTAHWHYWDGLHSLERGQTLFSCQQQQQILVFIHFSQPLS